MIAKILNGTDLDAVIAYNTKKIDGEVATILSTHKLILPTDNPNDSSMSEIIKAFSFRTDRSSIKNKAKHIIINPAENDLPDDRLIEITKDYIKEMNLGDQPYMIVKHQDIEKTHVHIVTTNVNRFGKSISTSNENRRSDKVRKKLEAKYGLISCENKKMENDFATYIYKLEQELNAKADEIKSIEDIESIKKGDKQIVSRIRSIIRQVYNDCSFTNIDEYNSILAPFNIKARVVHGTDLDGKPYSGIKYSIKSAGVGTQSTREISGKEIGKDFTYPKLLEVFNKNQEQNKSLKQYSQYGHRKLLSAIQHSFPNTDTQPTSKELCTSIYKLTKNCIYSVKEIADENGQVTDLLFTDKSKNFTRLSNILGKERAEQYLSSLTTDYINNSKEYYKEYDKEYKELSKDIRRVYDEVKKSKYFYYTDMIMHQDRHYAQILDELEKQYKYLSREDIMPALNSYFDYKEKELDKQKDKETSYLKQQVSNLSHILNKIEPTKQAEFVKRYGYESDGFTVWNQRSNTISIEAKNFPNTSKVKLPLKPLSKQDKEFLTKVCNNEYTDLPQELPSNKNYLLSFLNEQKQAEARQKLLPNYVIKFKPDEYWQLVELGFILSQTKDAQGKVQNWITDPYSNNTKIKLPDYKTQEEGSRIAEIMVNQKNEYGLPTDQTKAIIAINRAFESGSQTAIQKAVNDTFWQVIGRNQELTTTLLLAMLNQDYNRDKIFAAIKNADFKLEPKAIKKDEGLITKFINKIKHH